MSVSILIISHGDIGISLISTAKQMIGHSTSKITALNANIDLDANIEATVDELYTKASSLVKEIDQGDGVLILTDLFGSTPSNIACRLYEKNNISIVTGVNLSMVIRILNSPDLTLEAITEKACSGGIDGIKIREFHNGGIG
jgi:PTS system ascorbate-specific IIA component